MSGDVGTLWRAGRLRYKLHDGQKKAYDEYRAWEKAAFEKRKREEEPDGAYPRVFVFNCGRRFGKDFLCCLIRVEDCLRGNQESLYSYGTAHAKDIASIVIPLIEKICEDCPPSLKPVFKQSYQGTEAGYYFKNGAVLKLVGLDTNPDSLRGRWSNGTTISEASFVDKLLYVVQEVVSPMFLGHPTATLILNSTPAEAPGHPYKTEFVVDAKKRGAYQKFTTHDNPKLKKYEIDELIRQFGGVESDKCRREVFCEDVRSETRTVVPEFSAARHVIDHPKPRHAYGYTIVDPGVKDLCAVVCGYYDFERAKLVIVSDWAERNAPTPRVAQAVRDCERRAFEGLTFWKDKAFAENPFQRFSDVDARLIMDLNRLHGLKIAHADKDGKDAALNAVRNAFHSDWIEIQSTAPIVAQHVESAMWNKTRTDYERSDILGHCDALDCLKYMVRHVNRNLNPMPPYGIVLAQGVPLKDIQFRPEHMQTQRAGVEVAKKLLPGGRWARRTSLRR